MTTLTLFNYNKNKWWAFKQMGLHRTHFLNIKGLHFFKMLGTKFLYILNNCGKLLYPYIYIKCINEKEKSLPLDQIQDNFFTLNSSLLHISLDLVSSFKYFFIQNDTAHMFCTSTKAVNTRSKIKRDV